MLLPPAVMGYDNPLAERGAKPFGFCDNHLLLAQQADGSAVMGEIEVPARRWQR